MWKTIVPFLFLVEPVKTFLCARPNPGKQPRPPTPPTHPDYSSKDASQFNCYVGRLRILLKNRRKTEVNNRKTATSIGCTVLWCLIYRTFPIPVLFVLCMFSTCCLDGFVFVLLLWNSPSCHDWKYCNVMVKYLLPCESLDDLFYAHLRYSFCTL